ncbi:MAG: isoprenylcysteine carboxylmethyltransferase family protein [Anaerolineae bacterium]|nr:isoprenylcysteine carboxylmethyltransferase family protein [Anaerolineae bacterium]
MPTSLRTAAIALLIGIVIFIGLPLVGWGVEDVRGFFDHPARLSYVGLVLLLQVLTVIRLPAAGRSRGTGKKTGQRRNLDLVLIQVLSLAVVIAAPYSDRREIAVLGAGEIIRYLGLGMLALGFVTMHWAEVSLDRQFSIEVTIQENHKLVTGGPYRYLRHPRYLGIIIFTAGIALIYRSWAALILAAMLTLVLVWRIHAEEKLLHETFGADWEDYSRRSWRIIPFVY